MFNPSTLKVIRQGTDVDNNDGFVGIRHTQNGETEFCLPFGFENFPRNDKEKVTKMFFSLYKTFRYFQDSTLIEDKDIKSKDIDGLVQTTNGFTFINKDDVPVTIYSELASIESILKSYDELRIFSLVTRYKRTERINYAHIDKYLHQSIYLDNHIPFIDEMILPQPILEYSITNLVQMYCYVLCEIKQQLEETKLLPTEIIDEAKIFHELYLQPDVSLFSENHDYTISLLRSVLDEISQKVALKDSDYWYFYEALESFLYGTPSPNKEDEILWGITNFSPVWEDMCMVYFNENEWKGVWYADTYKFANDIYGGRKIFLDKEYKNPFYFNLNEKKRWMRPDLVRFISSENVDEWFESTFEINWIDINSCSIKVRDSNDLFYFNALDKKIRKRNPLRFSKNKNQTKFTYKPVKQLYVKEAINEFKNQTKNTARFSQPSFHAIIDFKYVDIHSYQNKEFISTKIKTDIIKQLCYEFAVILNKPNNTSKTKSQFCIPFIPLDRNNDYDRVDAKKLNIEIVKQGIELWFFNFFKVQKCYLSN